MKTWRESVKQLRNMDWILTLTLLFLLALGILFIYSACYGSRQQGMSARPFWQGGWIAIGGVGYLVGAVSDYRRLTRWAPLFYLAGVILLVLVLAVGVTVYGARRWLALPGGFQFQPAEVAKLAVVLLLARLLSRPEKECQKPAFVLGLLGIVALPVVLILQEPDLSSGILLATVAVVMLFVGGVPARYLLGLAGVAVVAVLIVLAVIVFPARLGLDAQDQARVFRILGLREHQRNRLIGFLSPQADPLGSGWNKMQSEIAVGSGGIWGKGYLQGRQNTLGYLPPTITPTDFIFAVMAEETGFAGCLSTVTVFTLLLVRILGIAVGAQDKRGCLLAVGMAAMVFVHAFVNMAMTVGVLPIAGVPLPLMSYGGTFLTVTLTGLGLVQSVRIHSMRPRAAE